MWIDILVLLIPLAIGAAQALKKYDLIDDFTENLNDWIEDRIRKNGSRDTLAAMTVRYSLIPFLSLFIIIHDLTENIRDFGLKSGVRIASYLYLMVFLFVVSITFGYKVLFLMLTALVLLNVFMLIHNHLPKRHTTAAGDSSQDFVETIWPFFRADSTRERVAGLFNVPQIDVDYTGNILAYDRGDSPGKKKIGRVDQLGHIYDTRHAASKKVGWINEQGHVICDSIINMF